MQAKAKNELYTVQYLALLVHVVSELRQFGEGGDEPIEDAHASRFACGCSHRRRTWLSEPAHSLPAAPPTCPGRFHGVLGLRFTSTYPTGFVVETLIQN